MEKWVLHHPDAGTIEVEQGFDAEFAQRYPSWPKPTEPKPGTHPGLNASLLERAKAKATNPPMRLQITVNGEVRRRLSSVPNGRAPLTRNPKEEPGNDLENALPSTVSRTEPHLYLRLSPFGDINSIEYRDGKQVVEFTPPPDSRGELRARAMADSSVKRVLYPLASGFGKGGWALLMIFVMPVLVRWLEKVVNWVLDRIPEAWVPVPPDIELPTPQLPSITLPVPRLPDWELPLPDVEIPAWVGFLADYSKVWVPIVVAIFVGIIAVRNHRRSEEQKRKWESESEPA